MKEATGAYPRILLLSLLTLFVGVQLGCAHALGKAQQSADADDYDDAFYWYAMALRDGEISAERFADAMEDIFSRGGAGTGTASGQMLLDNRCWDLGRARNRIQEEWYAASGDVNEVEAIIENLDELHDLGEASEILRAVRDAYCPL